MLSLRIKEAYFRKLLKANFTSRVSHAMKTAYFEHSEGDEKVYVTLNFNDFDVKRVLSFHRNALENVGSSIERIEHKVLTNLEKKKKTLPEDLQDKSSVFLLNNECVPKSVVLQDLFKFNGDLKLRIFGNDYDVKINFPVIKSITLPKQLVPESIIHAEVFETKFTDESKSEYVWYRSQTPTKLKFWEKCGEGFFYKIKKEDIDYYLKLACTPKCGEKVGPVFETVTDTPVKHLKNFEEIQRRQEFTKEETKPEEVRIVSYNILSDMYVKTKDGKTVLFVHCDPAYLDIDYRKILLNFELVGYKADIICLQEVQRSFYKSNILVLFTEMGYDCFYNEKEGHKEGCSILYKRSKFNLLDLKQYVLTKELLYNPLFNDIKVKNEGNESLIKKMQCLSSQIQILILKTLNKEVLIVGNTHFYSNPNADHIRLLQGVISWRILSDIAEKIKAQEPNKRVSIIFCGDFNSTPDCAFHQLLRTGSLDDSDVAWKSNEDEAINGVSCEHSLNMISAYSPTLFTNYTPLFKGCLDYIYFQSDNLELKQVVPIPSEEVLGMCDGIPSKYFPSDHVALVADLKFKNAC